MRDFSATPAPADDRTVWDGVSAKQPTDFVLLSQWKALRALVVAIAANVPSLASEVAAPSRVYTKRTITGAYTLVAADATDIVLHSTSGTAINITLPQDSAATISQEVAIPWRQYAAGQLTFVGGTGATVVSRGNVFKSAAQYAEGYVTKVAANTWVVSGDIVA